MDFQQLSKSATAISLSASLAAGGAVVALLFMVDKRLGYIAISGIVLTGAVLIIYHSILARMAKKRASSMSGQIQEHSAGAPMGINDPAKRARLDDMKRNFESGLDKFKTSGKDVYKLPWYLIVGEPGSGKTEAVRHCNVGFPPGLQDELQGVGGTINMNWWFTNHAVLLDTAGRLMFEEVKPGETSEWREFLQLLKRNRPNCPVNGLLLVIPAESLIRDTTEAISKKAGKIAQQLDLIQRTLDVRFPVFILVTKCDLLSGFREFFEDLTDPQTQHQMLGWSNPEPRDSVFRPELVTEHLETVTERIRKRRLGLLRDPIPQKEGGKRADEVDALFGLPQSFSLIGPRLRSYLETVFVAGEWSAKPLFLRGIYFTSAMREGAALDQELAEAIGVSLDDLPEGRAWERERAYFLRDLFIEKVFREKGLVTKASNTKGLLRRRQMYLYGSGAAAMLALLGFSFLGYQSLKSSIGQQSQYWAKAKRDWNAGVWRPIVERQPAAHDKYKGDMPAFTGDSTTLAEYQDKMRELCEKSIQISWVFKPIAQVASFEGERKKAQRVLFEGGVVNPLAKEARRFMVEGSVDPSKPQEGSASITREAEALAALIHIEADAVTHNSAIESLPDGLIAPLLRYTTGREEPADPAGFRILSNTFIWTYSKNPNGHWPPPWLSAGTTLATNKPIQAGLDRLLKRANDSIGAQEAALADIRKIRDLLRQFRQKETELNSMAASTDSREVVYNQMHKLEGDLKVIKENLDKALKDVETHARASGGRFDAGKAYEKLVAQSQTQSKDAFDIVEKSVADFAAKPNDPVNSNNPLFVEVDAKLKEARANIENRIAGGFTQQERDELRMLNDQLIADFGNGKRFYEVRWAAYDNAHAQLFQPEGKESLIGQKWASITRLLANIGAQRQALASMKDKIQEPFLAACNYFLDRAEEIRVDQVMRQYISQSRTAFDNNFHYPLVKEGGRSGGKGGMGSAERLLAEWKGDLTSDNLKQIQSLRKQTLANFLNDLDQISGIIPLLNGTVNIGLVGYGESPDKAGLNHFRKVVLKGHEYDTSTERASGTYGFFDSFNADFLDYSVTPRKSYGYHEGVMELLSRARSGGGRITISVGGFSIYLQASADRQPPNLANLPDKQKILADLN